MSGDNERAEEAMAAQEAIRKMLKQVLRNQIAAMRWSDPTSPLHKLYIKDTEALLEQVQE